MTGLEKSAMYCSNVGCSVAKVSITAKTLPSTPDEYGENWVMKRRLMRNKHSSRNGCWLRGCIPLEGMVESFPGLKTIVPKLTLEVACGFSNFEEIPLVFLCKLCK